MPTRYDASLTVATWNIRNLALPGLALDGCCVREAADYDALRRVGEATGADLVAVQEVSGPGALGRVFPSAAWVLCFAEGCDVPAPAAEPPTQRLGFAVRRGTGLKVAGVRSVPDFAVTVDGVTEYPGLELTLVADGKRLAFLNLHLAGCYDGLVGPSVPDQACRAMAAQVPVLAAWVEGRWAIGFSAEGHRIETAAQIVLGDLNRRFGREDPGAPGAPGPALARLGLARGHLDARLCWPDDPDLAHAHSVDWVFVGGRTRIEPGSSRRLAFDEVAAISPLPPIDLGRRTLSDHCPVRARLRF